MKGTKTSLFLIELMISLLLFAFCAAICVQIFHASNKRTNSAEDLSKAVFQATTMAELYKSTGGDIEALSEMFEPTQSFFIDGVLSLYFDGSWNETLTPILRSSFVSSGYTLTISDNGDKSAEINVVRTAVTPNDNNFATVNELIFGITVKAVVS